MSNITQDMKHPVAHRTDEELLLSGNLGLRRFGIHGDALLFPYNLRLGVIGF